MAKQGAQGLEKLADVEARKSFAVIAELRERGNLEQLLKCAEPAASRSTKNKMFPNSAKISTKLPNRKAYTKNAVNKKLAVIFLGFHQTPGSS